MPLVQISHEIAVKPLAGDEVSSVGSPAPKPTPCLLAALSPLPHGPFYGAAASRQGGWCPPDKQSMRKKKKAKSFYNLIPDWSPDHFCHILFFRNNSVSPAQTQGEGTARGCSYGGGCSEGPL